MKNFLLIGNKSNVIYKCFFPLIKYNKVWFGVTSISTFTQSDGTVKKFGNVGWFTNMDHKLRPKPLELTQKYTPEKCPKYDNYDAINVDRTKDIPCDYYVVIGVPVSFFDKYCPEQFEIIWQATGNSYANMPKGLLEYLKFDPTIKYSGGLGAAVLNGKAKYVRILIKRIPQI